MQLTDLNIPGYEKVVEAEIAPGVKSIIAVHNTKFGPALGGLRFFPYHSREDALTDVLRLSEGMSYKSALANLPLGGGKAVIIGDPKKVKTRALLEAMGEFVNALNGMYITAKDVGIEVEDLDIIATRTKFVRGLSTKDSGGDPSPVTAYGVYKGIKAAAMSRWGSDNLRGKKIIIQGMGHVGYGVAKMLHEEGTTLFVTDLDQKALDRAEKELNANVLRPDQWTEIKADIYCPCAMGATVNKQTIAKLKENGVQIIAGGANNQLLDVMKDGERLKDADITYAPDFVINAGGIINIACELQHSYDQQEALQKTNHIYDVLLEIFERAKKENRPTAIIATEMAREKLGLK
jgi:leucine dehydrogenase